MWHIFYLFVLMIPFSFFHWQITSLSALKSELKKDERKRCDRFFICDSTGPPYEVLDRMQQGNQQHMRRDTGNTYEYPSDNGYDENYEEDGYPQSMDQNGGSSPRRRGPQNQRGRQPVQTERSNQQRRQPVENGYNNMNGSKENVQRYPDEQRQRAGPADRSPPQTYRGPPPRQANKQVEKKNQRNQEKSVNGSGPRDIQQRKPDKRNDNANVKQNPPTNRQRNVRGSQDRDAKNSISSQESKEREEIATSRRPAQHEPERSEEMDGGYDDRSHDPQSERTRNEEDMEYEGGEDEDDDDDYDDEPGEPRAARKGPKMETPEFWRANYSRGNL